MEFPDEFRLVRMGSIQKKIQKNTIFEKNVYQLHCSDEFRREGERGTYEKNEGSCFSKT